MRPYHIKLVQALAKDQKRVRMECCQILAEIVKIQPDIVYLMPSTNEATFHISGHVNRHNTIFWGTENPRLFREHGRASPKVNIRCAVTAAGVIVPYFFYTPTVNSESYLHMLQSYAIDELPKIILSSGYFQQDGAPAQFGRIVRDFLDYTFPRRWIGRCGPSKWPHHAPDLTPCHFWLWGMVKERVYSTKVRNISELKERITNVVTSIPREFCVRVLNATFSLFLLCVDNNGQQVENLHT
jgi:hypothetical protein